VLSSAREPGLPLNPIQAGVLPPRLLMEFTDLSMQKMLERTMLGIGGS